jgi:hypothetical protein
MITDEHLRRKPDALASPTGMTVAVFDAFLSAQTQCQQAATHTKRGQTSHRAPGAGSPHDPHGTDAVPYGFGPAPRLS